MNNIYLNDKGIKFKSFSHAMVYANTLNETTEGGFWTSDLDKNNELYLYFVQQEDAKVGA
jgi:hypothetical protein